MKMYFHENLLENVVGKIAAILLKSCVINQSYLETNGRVHYAAHLMPFGV